MIHYKSKAEIELVRESSLLVSDALALLAASIKSGVTTLQLDKIAEEFIKDNKKLFFSGKSAEEVIKEVEKLINE